MKILGADLRILDSEIKKYLDFDKAIKSAQEEKTNAESKINDLGNKQSDTEVMKLLKADSLLYGIENNKSIRKYGLVGILAPPILIGGYKALTGQDLDFSSTSDALHYFFSTNNEIARAIELGSEFFGVFYASGGHIFKRDFEKQFEKTTGYKVRAISKNVKEKANYIRDKIKNYPDEAGKAVKAD